MKVKGEAAAKLATMGVQRVRDNYGPSKTIRPATPDADAAPEVKPEVKPETKPEVKPDQPTAQLNSTATPGQPGTQPTTQPATSPTTSPTTQPTTPPGTPPEPQKGPQTELQQEPKPATPPGRAMSSTGVFPMLAQMTAPSISPGAGQPDPNRVYIASEFPNEFEIPRVYSLALLIHKAAYPPARPATPDSAASASAMMKLWPQRLAHGMWPVRLAWAVAVTEVIAGFFVLVGLLTRASAICLAGTMLGAIWLTEIGPAIQAGTTVLGILPDREPFALEPWKNLLWQMSLLMSAAALAFLGSGALGFDRKLFPPPPPAPPIPKPMI